ncbi:uncharacterized protein LOC126883846 [Diabrotica virgifera virgifera]|uniref:Uncharacterized protein n=1 Tax=Diabrotica virgifera virgifera TaxID=50390 RepID=A0ABM5K5M5_DIAVI|nr:uncharacterized protein LOC126883846 [Diabrotica virgifera virgifera]
MGRSCGKIRRRESVKDIVFERPDDRRPVGHSRKRWKANVEVDLPRFGLQQWYAAKSLRDRRSSREQYVARKRYRRSDVGRRVPSFSSSPLFIATPFRGLRSWWRGVSTDPTTFSLSSPSTINSRVYRAKVSLFGRFYSFWWLKAQNQLLIPPCVRLFRHDRCWTHFILCIYRVGWLNSITSLIDDVLWIYQCKNIERLRNSYKDHLHGYTKTFQQKKKESSYS